MSASCNIIILVVGGVKGEYPEQRKLQRLDINERKLQLRKDFLDLPCLVVCHVREGLAGWEMIAFVEVVVSAEAEERDEEGVSEEEGGDVYEDKCTGLHYGWGYGVGVERKFVSISPGGFGFDTCVDLPRKQRTNQKVCKIKLVYSC